MTTQLSLLLFSTASMIFHCSLQPQQMSHVSSVKHILQIYF